MSESAEMPLHELADRALKEERRQRHARLNTMSRRERAEKLEVAKECLKWASHDLLECSIADPLSIEMHMAAITVRQIKTELAELEGCLVAELAS